MARRSMFRLEDPVEMCKNVHKSAEFNNITGNVNGWIPLHILVVLMHGKTEDGDHF